MRDPGKACTWCGAVYFHSVNGRWDIMGPSAVGGVLAISRRVSVSHDPQAQNSLRSEPADEQRSRRHRCLNQIVPHGGRDAPCTSRPTRVIARTRRETLKLVGLLGRREQCKGSTVVGPTRPRCIQRARYLQGWRISRTNCACRCIRAVSAKAMRRQQTAIMCT